MDNKELIKSINWLNIFMLLYFQVYKNEQTNNLIKEQTNNLTKEQTNESKDELNKEKDELNKEKDELNKENDEMDILMGSIRKMREGYQMKGELIKSKIEDKRRIRQINEQLTQEMIKMDKIEGRIYKKLRKGIIKEIQELQGYFDKI